RPSPTGARPSGRSRVIRQEHHEEGDRHGQAVPDQGRRGEHAWADHPQRGLDRAGRDRRVGQGGPAGPGRGRGAAGAGDPDGGGGRGAGGPTGAARPGHERGAVTLGGRRVGAQRPRVRAADGSGELPVAAYELFSGTEVLGRLALERMLGGLSTRRYPLGLGAGGTRGEQAATRTSKSAISRRFVAMTQVALAELLSADLSTLDLVCLMIDGV